MHTTQAMVTIATTRRGFAAIANNTNIYKQIPKRGSNDDGDTTAIVKETTRLPVAILNRSTRLKLKSGRTRVGVHVVTKTRHTKLFRSARQPTVLT